MSSRRVPPGVFVLRAIQVALSAAVALASVWGLLGGCREQTTVPIDRNRAPETFVTSAPGDSQTSFYRVAMHWSGTDHDGVVVAFEVAVTESLPDEEEIQWRRTRRSDSLMTFRVEETREVLGHRFYVRAIDNESKRDPTPAWIFFGARNNVPPQIHFYRALAFGPDGETDTLTSTNAEFPTDTIPTGWGVTFAWNGTDADVALDPDGNVVQVGSVASYSHRLLPVESEFLGGTLADTASSYPASFFFALPKGNVYAFNVKAIDDGGLSGSGAVTRSFVWNRDPESRIQRCVRPGETDSVVCFESLGSAYYSGDTLALPISASDPYPDARFSARAYDPDPVDGDHSVATLEWRPVVGGVISSWRTLETGGQVVLEDLATNKYIAMVRAVDRLERVESTPDSVTFYVNFSPRFVTQEGSFHQDPMPMDTFSASHLTSAGLACSLLATDPDANRNAQIRYSLNLQPVGQGLEPSNHHRNTLSIGWVYTPVLRADTLWAPGDYILHVRAEDNKQIGGEQRGTRSRVRSVRFTVLAE